MRYADFTAMASSTLKEADGTEHIAENVADYGRDTAWVEGQESDGVGGVRFSANCTGGTGSCSHEIWGIAGRPCRLPVCKKSANSSQSAQH